MKNIVVSILLFVVMFIGGCKEDDSNPIENTTGETGTVTGEVFSKNGVEKIQGALVTVANLSNSPQAVTDNDGKYSLPNVPSGSQTLLINKGLFQSSVSLDVVAGVTTTAPQVKLEATGKLGFVAGSYDNIQQIIRDDLGYAIDSLASSDLNDAGKLSNYKAIFLNCGLDESPIYSGAGLTELKNFIQNGGSVYASDWAGEFIEFMFPDNIAIETSGAEQIITATIVDQNLKNFIGKETVEINFDMGGWGEIVSMDQTVTSLLIADYTSYVGGELTNKPLAVSFTYGNGKVIYTSFHNEANVTSDAIKVLIGFLYSL